MRSPLQSLFLRHIAQTSPEPLMLEVGRAQGVYIYDTAGKPYLDLISGIAVSNTGHGAPEVLEAIHKQSETYLHTMVYGEHVQGPQVAFARKLVERANSSLTVTYFANSGSEAVDGALKIAKKFTGRSGLIACDDSYHGSSHAALSVTGIDYLKDGYGPLLPNVSFIRFGETADLEGITENTAAFILEPIQSAMGYKVPPQGYLQAVRKRCDETGALLILDEIQTGLGRTGSWFAFQDAGIEPDLLLLAKSLCGGLPGGAILARPQLMDVISHDPILGLISTFGGHPLCCAAGLAAIEKTEREELVARIPEKEALIRRRLIHPAIQEIRGKGLMLAVELGSGQMVQELVFGAMDKGVLTDWFLSTNTAFRITPPLVITEEELKEGIDVLLETLNIVY